MSKHTPMPLQPSDLDNLDHAILDYLQQDRDNPDTPWGIATPALVLAELQTQNGTTPVRQTINNRMKRLSLAGHLDNLHDKGVYRFKSDPRNE